MMMAFLVALMSVAAVCAQTTATQQCKKQTCAAQKCEKVDKECKNAVEKCDQAKQKCDQTAQKCDKAKQKCDKAAQKCDKAKQKCDQAIQKCDKAAQKCKQECKGKGECIDVKHVCPTGKSASKQQRQKTNTNKVKKNCLTKSSSTPPPHPTNPGEPPKAHRDFNISPPLIKIHAIASAHTSTKKIYQQPMPHKRDKKNTTSLSAVRWYINRYYLGIEFRILRSLACVGMESRRGCSAYRSQTG